MAQTSPTPLPNAPVDQPQVAQPTTTEEYNKLVDSWFPSADSKAKATTPPSGVTSTVQVDGTPFPERVNAVDGSAPKAFVVHHTGGSEKDANGVLDELNQRHLGVEFVAERDGRIVQIGGPGSQNIKTSWGKGEGLNNSNVVGIEVIAKNVMPTSRLPRSRPSRIFTRRFMATFQLTATVRSTPAIKRPTRG